MKYFVIALAAFFISSSAHAACTTFGTMASCSDGNTYNKIGNTIYGSNSRTGSSWSQTTIGNSTYGTASDGCNWSTTRMCISSWGTDSSGNSRSCFGNVCNLARLCNSPKTNSRLLNNDLWVTTSLTNSSR